MSQTLSPEIEKLAQQYVDGDQFTSANDVILVAMRLFGECQARYRDELGLAIKRGFDQIDRGDGIELKNDDALREFFDDIKQRGRVRYDAGKGE